MENLESSGTGIPENVNAESFGELLKFFRRRKEMTQETLTRHLGMRRRATLADWEVHRYAPRSRDRVIKIATILELSDFERELLLNAAIIPLENAEPPFEPHNPYKGLHPFTLKDAHYFFGREELIQNLAKALLTSPAPERQDIESPRFLAVTGPSGSGKTSLIQAGLLARLQQNSLCKHWMYLHITSLGEDPLNVFATELAEYFPARTTVEIRQALDDPTQSLPLLSSTLLQQTEAKIILIVDQAEELFTRVTDEHIRTRFLNILVQAVTLPHGQMWVILIFRSDFYSQFQKHSDSEMARLIADHQYPVMPMDAAALHKVIEGPTEVPDVKLRFENNLVTLIVAEMQGQVGCLPLLQFTLDQLFKNRKGHLLTKQAYNDMDGVRGALARYAQSIYKGLPSEKHRDLVPFLFMRLISLDPLTAQLDPRTIQPEMVTRRGANLEEFAYPNQEEKMLMGEVISSFIAARLLVINEIAGKPILEVSHEALLQKWQLSADLIRDDHDAILLQQTLTRDVAEWQRRERPRDRLYHGTQFKEAQALAKRNAMSRQEQAFLRASAARHQRSLLTVIAVILLVVTSSGIAGWVVLSQPNPNYVTKMDDSRIGSLPWAIKNASSNSTITFAPTLIGETIVLKNIAIHITQQNLTIQGPTIGRNTVRVIGASLVVDHSASATISGIAFQGSNIPHQSSLIQNTGRLMLKNCTISGNTASGSVNSYSDGGGIFNSGTLTISSSTISGNTASGNDNLGDAGAAGGGISNEGGTLTISSSTISGNTVFGFGGGIYNAGGIVTISSSFIFDNKAFGPIGGSGSGQGSGGGIDSYDGLDRFYPAGSTLTISSSSISGNTAFASGGGISNEGSTLTISSSTISGNTAQDGGGIFNGGTLALTSSTLSGNTAVVGNSGGGTGSGGGIGNGGTLALTSSTLSGNTSSASGGGINNDSYNNGTQGPISTTLIFCTIVNNKAPRGNGSDIANLPDYEPMMYVKASIVGGNDTQSTRIAGRITSGGYNVIQRMSSVVFVLNKAQSTDQSVDDLAWVLGPSPILQKNGGLTQTYLLVPDIGDVALNAIPPDVCTDTQDHRVLTDQRGMSRPGKNKQSCDSGAYESQG